MSYMFKSILLVWVVFPILTILSLMLATILLNIYEDMVFGIFQTNSWLTGICIGIYHARKSTLPDNLASRYWPLLTPMVFIIITRIIYNVFSGAASFDSIDSDKMITKLALCYVPLILSFAVCTPAEKKLSGKKWRWQTCVFIIALFAVLEGQAKLKYDNIPQLQKGYGGATIMDHVVVFTYWPWVEPNRLTNLDTPTSLLLSDDFPLIDGATSFVPIYAAVVNEIYQVEDKEDLQNYMTCSRTSAAYDRLIQGEVDMIFVFQPSDGQLAAAKEAGIDLKLTPIAKEAFIFFVNSNNPVSDLSIEQIQDIYMEKITNWQEIGGNNKKILPFQRPENSGSQTAMLKDVMKDIELPPPLKRRVSSSMGQSFTDVAMYRDYEESIGYSFRYYTQVMVKYDYSRVRDPERNWGIDPDAEPVKLLSVNGIAPTAENIRSGSYPFTQDVYVVTADTTNPHVEELIDWLLSPQGQELIEKVGYVRAVL